jgi:Mlc titration factor MtfA (ptsG expression regulator)
MFRWLTDHRRKILTEAAFPEAWEEIIRRNVTHYCMLDNDERAHLQSLIQVFIAEKNWEGLGGLERPMKSPLPSRPRPVCSC